MVRNLLELWCHNCNLMFKSKKQQRLCPECKMAKAQCKWDVYVKRSKRIFETEESL